MKIRGNYKMMTCMESYACICENLEWNPSAEAKEALDVIREFRHVFEAADAAIEDPILQEICRNISELHFKTEYPLVTNPVETIRREYQKRTGNSLNAYFCTIAYHNTVIADKEKARNTDILDADSKQQKALKERMKEKQEQNCRSGGN